MSTTEFKQECLKTIVAQICQVIGFQSIYSVPLDVLSDLLHRYLLKIATTTSSYAEHCGRTEATVEDVEMAFNEMGVSVSDLEEYVTYVDPVHFPHKVPKIPVARQSNMNFLKPGSREILSRPIHVHEHLPPMYPEKEEEDDTNLSTSDILDDEGGEIFSVSPTPRQLSEGETTPKKRKAQDDEGQPVREIDSVMMTTSGFISSAREGKMADSRKPNINLPPLPTLASTRDSLIKKKSTLEKIIKRQNTILSPMPKPPIPREFKPRLPGAPPGPGIHNQSKESPMLKIPTPKTSDQDYDPSTDPERKRRKDERHKDRRKERREFKNMPESVSKEIKRDRIRMRMRGLSKEEELRRYKEREKELIAALEASSAVSIANIPPPEKRVREKTPEKDMSDKDMKKLKKLKEIMEKNKVSRAPSPPMIDIQNIKEEKIDPPEEEIPAPLPPFQSPSMHLTNMLPSTSDNNLIVPKVTKKSHTNKKPSDKPPRSRPSKPKKPKQPKIEPPMQSPPMHPDMFHHPVPFPQRSPPPPILPAATAPGFIPPFNQFMDENLYPPDIKPSLDSLPKFPSPQNEPIRPPTFDEPVRPDFSESILPPTPLTIRPIENMTPPVEDLHPISIPPSLNEKLSASSAPTISTPLDHPPKEKPKKEHKKDKKSKDKDTDKEKSKKKKDKKDKERSKEEKEKKKEKERIKQEKKEKKKKLKEDTSVVPKIMLKLKSEEPPPQHSEPKTAPKIVIKTVGRSEEAEKHHTSKLDEPGSPEIAKISALYTRPPKKPKLTDTPVVPPIKINKDNVKKSEKKKKHVDVFPKVTEEKPLPSTSIFSPPRTHSKTSKSFSKSSPGITAETVGPIGHFVDDQGNKVWICPTCGKQDDGSPMIGCDTCDDWYHWVCVGIQVPPNEEENWYCSRCLMKQKNKTGGEKKKRGRRRKLSNV